MRKKTVVFAMAIALFVSVSGCGRGDNFAQEGLFPRKPLVTHMYTADPSAHVFEDKIYIYPSHDIESNIPDSNEGDQFDMRDYHVLSIESFKMPVEDHGVVLKLEDVPWASRQLWAPDAAYNNGIYYFYFPAKDKDGIFRIGVATGEKPYGPFKAEPEPIKGSFSMDPAVFVDDDGSAYMYFGGLWGGQIERWRSGSYDPDGRIPAVSEPALGPKFARMADNMLEFDGAVKEIKIVDDNGNPVKSGDRYRWFFEAPWVHKYKDTYYLSYSTGPTHCVVYATSDRPDGPFRFRGILLEPVIGWTTHHSILKYKGRWYLFYHDSSLPGGKTHLRCIKYVPIEYDREGLMHISKKK